MSDAPTTCPSCGAEVEPVRQRIPGQSSALRFGWFCPSATCRARLDHLVEKKPDETLEPARVAAKPAAEVSFPARAPARLSSAAPPTNDLCGAVRAKRDELRALVDSLRDELERAEKELDLFERMAAILPPVSSGESVAAE